MSAGPVRYVVKIEGARHEVELGADGSVRVGGRSRSASLVGSGRGGGRSLLLDGASVALVARSRGRGEWRIAVDGRDVDAQVFEAHEAEMRERGAGAAGSAGVAPLTAPMPGLVVRVAVRAGDEVLPGTAIVIVEAMKMENELRAAAAARVARIRVSPGDAVEKGQILAEFAVVDAP